MTQSNRLWTIGAVTLMIVMLLAGYFLGAQPLLAATAASDLETSNLKQQNIASAAVVTQLAADNKGLAGLETTLAELQKSVPSSADSANFIDNLNALANAADVKVSGVALGDPRPYTVPESATIAPVDPAADGATDPAATDDAPAAPVEPVVDVPAVVTNPLITPENFVGIQTTIQLKGTYAKVLDFVSGLQADDRLFLVTGITSQREPDSDGQVNATVLGYIYVLRLPTADTAVEAPAAP